MKKLASIFVGIASLALVSSAQAQTPPAFGDKGTLVIHAATGDPLLAGPAGLDDDGDARGIGATPLLGIQTTRYSQPDQCNGNTCSKQTTSLTAIYVAPRFHYFVIDNLSIGGEVLFASYSGSTKTVTNNIEVEQDFNGAPTALGIMPLIGYNVRLGERFSLWPTGGIGFRRLSGTFRPNNPNTPDTDLSQSWVFVNVDVPFLFHPTTNFAIGAGPGITATLSQSFSSKTGPVETSVSGYGTTDIRWLTAHMIGWF